MEMQQDFLRAAMKQLGHTRNSFAAALDIKRPRLDTWLLPDSSQSHRKLMPEYHHKICLALGQDTIGKMRDLSEGEFSELVRPIYCDKFNFRFPTLFQHSGFYFNRDNSPNKKRPCRSYSLSSSTADSFYVEETKPVTHVSPGDGWIYIDEHRNLDRADGFLRGMACVDEYTGDSSGLFSFEGRFFTIHQKDKPQNALVDGLILYSSDLYLDHTPEFLTKLGIDGNENSWTVNIGPDGQIFNGHIFDQEEINKEIAEFMADE